MEIVVCTVGELKQLTANVPDNALLCIRSETNSRIIDGRVAQFSLQKHTQLDYSATYYTKVPVVESLNGRAYTILPNGKLEPTITTPQLVVEQYCGLSANHRAVLVLEARETALSDGEAALCQSPKSAWDLFCQDALAAEPTLGTVVPPESLIHILGDRWLKLSSDKKAMYFEQCNTAQNIHEQQLTAARHRRGLADLLPTAIAKLRVPDLPSYTLPLRRSLENTTLVSEAAEQSISSDSNPFASSPVSQLLPVSPVSQSLPVSQSFPLIQHSNNNGIRHHPYTTSLSSRSRQVKMFPASGSKVLSSPKPAGRGARPMSVRTSAKPLVSALGRYT